MRSRMKALVKIVLALLLTVALCATSLACGTVTINPNTGEIIIETTSQPNGQSATTGADWQLPSIESFTASPSSISPGETSTLEWDVFGATEIAIDQGIGAVERTGNNNVSPLATITHTLTAKNAAGSTTRSVTITVGTTTASTPPPSSPTPSQFTPSSPTPSLPPPSSTPPPTLTPPVINTFTASPSSIVAGGISNLVWSVAGATNVHIGPGGGYVPSSGSAAVQPPATITFTLTATNAAGSVTRSVTVSVAAAAAPPATTLPVINSFSANPSSLSGAGTSTLMWSTSGATSAALSPGGGSVPTSGSAVATLSSTKTFTLTATNSVGSVSRSVTVAVAAAPASPPVINSFTASPTSIDAGGNSTLSWNVTGATSVTLSPGGGSVPASGSAVATLSSTRTYTLTATNSTGSVTRSVTVTVAAAPASPPPASPPPPADTAACEQALFNAVNAIRTSNGKAALTRNSYIDGLCRQHAQYMATAGDLSHDNFSARCSSIMANVSGIHTCAENVLQDNTPCDATAMAQLWFNSPGHNANMLNAAYTVAGMGIVIDGSGKIWACQIFAGP